MEAAGPESPRPERLRCFTPADWKAYAESLPDSPERAALLQSVQLAEAPRKPAPVKGPVFYFPKRKGIDADKLAAAFLALPVGKFAPDHPLAETPLRDLLRRPEPGHPDLGIPPLPGAYILAHGNALSLLAAALQDHGEPEDFAKQSKAFERTGARIAEMMEHLGKARKILSALIVSDEAKDFPAIPHYLGEEISPALEAAAERLAVLSEAANGARRSAAGEAKARTRRGRPGAVLGERIGPFVHVASWFSIRATGCDERQAVGAIYDFLFEHRKDLIPCGDKSVVSRLEAKFRDQIKSGFAAWRRLSRRGFWETPHGRAMRPRLEAVARNMDWPLPE